MEQLKNFAAFFSRIALSAIFLIAGIHKITGFAATTEHMASRGMPATTFFALSALLIEILGGLSVLAGFKARYGALALFFFLIPTTLIFHTSLGGAFLQEQVQLQQIMLMKNLAIMGGLVAIAVHGPGGFSLDR